MQAWNLYSESYDEKIKIKNLKKDVYKRQALQFLNKQVIVITNNKLHLQKSPVEKILSIIWQQKENASIQNEMT